MIQFCAVKDDFSQNADGYAVANRIMVSTSFARILSLLPGTKDKILVLVLCQP